MHGSQDASDCGIGLSDQVPIAAWEVAKVEAHQSYAIVGDVILLSSNSSPIMDQEDC